MWVECARPRRCDTAMRYRYTAFQYQIKAVGRTAFLKDDLSLFKLHSQRGLVEQLQLSGVQALKECLPGNERIKRLGLNLAGSAPCFIWFVRGFSELVRCWNRGAG